MKLLKLCKDTVFLYGGMGISIVSIFNWLFWQNMILHYVTVFTFIGAMLPFWISSNKETIRHLRRR